DASRERSETGYPRHLADAWQSWHSEAPSPVRDAGAELREAAENLINRGVGRWISRGYGKYSCSSCGAERLVDYGDHEQPTTEKCETCSRNCPWAMLERALAPLPDAATSPEKD